MLLFVTLLLCSSCSQKDDSVEEIDFAEEGKFVEMRLASASQEKKLDHYPEIITVSNDGIVRVFTEDTYTRRGKVNLYVGEDPPEIEIEITDKEVEEIKQTITESKFFSLPTDVTDEGVMDGSSVYITVYARDEERKVGGQNPNNEQFSTVEDVIFEHVADEFYDWNEAVRAYIYEENDESLH